ncbi:MAG: translocation/assembly module TamB domain-containing protein [Chitinophagaceae bacterium]|nr:translocation/assembly module TamB domain-containing protein [Chitinophagaceae bacterium]
MRKFFKITLYIIGSILLLIVIAVLFLISPPGKQFVRKQALAFLRGKLKTEVQIGEIVYSLPKMVGLKGVLLKDRQNDTLLAMGLLKVDIDLLKLINSKVSVNDLVLEDVYAYVHRNKPDTNYNFTYIIDAFASKDTSSKPKDTSASSPLVFDVGTLRLSNIHIRFADQTGGIDLAADLKKLNIKMRELDPAKMVFRLKSLKVEGLQTRFAQDTSLIVSNDTTTSELPTLAADELDLKDIAFTFQSSLNHMLFDLQLSHLLAHPDNIDLNRQTLAIKDLQLDKTRSKIVLGKYSPVPEKAEEVIDTLDQQGWTVTVGRIGLEDIDFIMDNKNMPKVKQGMDYGHLGISALRFNANDVRYSDDAISGDIRHLSVKEKSGLELQELRTRFFYSDTAASLQGLYVKTPYTILQDNIQAKYPSIASLSTDAGKMQLGIRLEKSVIGMQDVLLFAPQLREQEMFRRYAHESVKLDAELNGFMNNLDISRLHITALRNTELDLKGKLSGLPDADKLRYTLDLKTVRSSSRDLDPLLPAETQKNVRLPDAFNIAGKLSGTAKDYYPDLVLNSTDGNAVIKGMLALSGGSGKERYDLAVQTRALNVGRIIRRDKLLGPITANLKVKGSSFDVKQMTANINGSVQSALVKGYAYRDISFDGKMAAQQGNFNLLSADPNARLRLDATADLRNKYPSFLADLVIDSMDLQALQLYKDQMKVQAAIHADVPEANPDYPDGIVTIRKPVVAANGALYKLDSIYVSSKPNADSGQNIIANLDFMQAAISGQIPLARIPDAIQEHINRHYMLQAKPDSAALAAAPQKKAADTSKTPLPGQYNLNLNALIYKSPFLEAFAPQLTQMDTVRIAAQMNQASLELDMKAPQIVYGSNQLQGFSLVLAERDSGMNYKAVLERFTQGSLKLVNTTVDGAIDANLISANLKTDDEAGKQRFALGATLQKEGEAQALSLKEGLMLNYTNWSVAQPNKIVFGPEGFYAKNVKLSGNGASIEVNSESPAFNVPLTASISNFRISDIMELVSGDTLFADGVLAGKAQLRQMKPAPLIDADFTITNLSVLQDTIGNVALKATNNNENDINAELSVSGNGNDVQLKGDYYTKAVEGNSFNFDLLVNALNLRSFEGLAQKQIRNSSGFVRGKINARGTTAAPLLNGTLYTDNLTTTVAMLNATFKMPQEKIIFSESGLRFDNFKILDSAGRTASINGSILTKNLKDLGLDLQVKADKWKALSSSPTDNKVFYGSLLLTTNLDISGTVSKPTVNGNLNILKGTDVTIVLPDRSLTVEDHAGIVVFVDKSDTGTLKAVPKDTMLLTKVAPGSEINVNITTDEEAEFNVIIDQATGDFLSVRGKAALNTSIDPGGSLSLNGLYELYSGAYQLNYNLIKRKFEIQKGSTITFAGDPLNAEMNVTAVYKANVAPYDLVERQVPDAAQLIYYRQALPFNVQLMMQGPLLLPDLKFDIVLPENNTYRLSSDAVQLVQAKLSQLRTDTSELNKQVFALLILKRFITDDPFSSGNGGGAEFAAKQSVSRFLGEQLNQFANQLINGVDLSVDLASTEDYTTGQRRERTDLNVAASKRLFNDRLKVTIGNNFELEGPQTRNTDPNSSLIPGNLAVDYSLSADNRYMVRAYRQNQDQGVIQGFVTETGVNFILSYDYNRFRNLFIRKKVLEMRRKQRQAQNTTAK